MDTQIATEITRRFQNVTTNSHVTEYSQRVTFVLRMTESLYYWQSLPII
jgi:hypothetical protein